MVLAARVDLQHVVFTLVLVPGISKVEEEGFVEGAGLVQAGLVVVAMLKAKEEDGTTMVVQGLVMELKVEIVLIIIGTLVLALMLDQTVVI